MAEFCVFRGKEFKECQQRFNLDADLLLMIVYKFINEELDADAFPSDDYIEDYLIGQNNVSSDAQVLIWQNEFSEPRTFSNADDAAAYADNAHQYFSDDAVDMHKTADGKYFVRVGEPVLLKSQSIPSTKVTVNDTALKLITDRLTNEQKLIREESISNGTFMKTSLGDNTELSEYEWLVSQTEGFKRWLEQQQAELDEEQLPKSDDFQILQNATKLNISPEEKTRIYEDYVKLMDRKREGKAVPRDKFDFMFEHLQVYKNGDTYIFGEWDSKNNLFRGRLISAPNIRALYSSLDILLEHVQFMASVPGDIGKMLRKKNLYELMVDKPYNFRGEDMIKHLYFSSKELAEKVFGKDVNSITHDEVLKYDMFYNQYKLINQLKKQFFTNDYQGMFQTLKELGIYDRNAYYYINKLRRGELTAKDRDDIIQHIISNTNSNKVLIHSRDTLNRAKVYNDLNTEINKILVSYLSKFGIKTEITDDLNKLGIDGYSTISLLNKIAYINKNKQENFPLEAGTIIATMMQHNPLVTEIMSEMLKRSMFRKRLSKEEKLRAVGDLIADELHRRTKEEVPKTLKDNIKNLIRQFFDFLNKIKLKRINRNIGYIVDNILILNEALITQSMFKPGSVGKPLTQVSLEKALKSDPFGSDIVEKLSSYFILTGSVSISELGTIFRPSENLLHDIDWASPHSSEENKRIFKKVFPNCEYIRQISDEGRTSVTDTWLIVPDGYTILNLELEGDHNIITHYDIVNEDGEIVNAYNNKKDSSGVRKESFVNNTIEGKTIDVFSDSSRDAYETKTLSGKPLMLSSWIDTFRAKLEYSRLKDIWDYNRFIPNENTASLMTTKGEPKKNVVQEYILENQETLNPNASRNVTVHNDNTGLSQEMAEIKAKAIANGTFMKAPNGKPTNLTETQWLQVRTKAFKDWFGDWEKVAPTETLTEEDKNYLSRFFKVLPEYEEIFNNDIVLLNEYLKSIFPNSKYRKMPFIHKSRQKIDKFEIIKGRNLSDAIWFSGSRKYNAGSGKNIINVALLNLENPIVYDDSGGKVNNATKYKNNVTDLGYDSAIFEPTWTKSTGELAKNELDQVVVQDLNRIHILGTEEDIKNAKAFVEKRNNVSKVVDENGEPLVVYTGVPIKGLTEFSLETEDRSSLTDILKKGIYFSSNRKVAEEYVIGKPIYKTTDKVNEQQAKKINTLYRSGELGIENLASEYIGLPNDVINEYINSNINEVTGELDVVSFPKGEVISAFLNIKNPTVVKHNGSTIAHLSKENRDAINNNNEGAIIENVNERTNYTGEANFDLIGTDYIVFNPNQIKSATSNVGTFSTENNDVNQFVSNDANGSLVIVKNYNSNSIQPNTTYGIDKIEEIYNSVATNDTQKALAKRVFAIAKQLGINVSFLHDDLGKNVGGIQQGNTIKFARWTLLNENSALLPNILLHEVIHSVTTYAINAYDDGTLKNKQMRQAVEEIKSVYEAIKNDKSLLNEYGLTNEKEMIAEMANPSFRNKLSKIKVWNRLKNAIKRLFFFWEKRRLSANDVLGQALDTLLDNFDLSLYNKYVGSEKNYFEFNELQKNAILNTSDFAVKVLKSDSSNAILFHTITGAAGTGKTTIVPEILSKIAQSMGKMPGVIIGALSNLASSVLYGKVLNSDTIKKLVKDAALNRKEGESDIDIIQRKTIAGMLGIRPDWKENGMGDVHQVFEMPDYKAIIENALANGIPIEEVVPPIFFAEVVVIDECSMINEEQLDNIKDLIQQKKDLGYGNTAVIFIGDKAQVPPIRTSNAYRKDGKFGDIDENADSPVFTEEGIEIDTLTERVRQGEGNPILDYAQEYRDFSEGVANESIDEDSNLPNSRKNVTKLKADKGAIIYEDSMPDGHSASNQMVPLFEEAKQTGNTNLCKIVVYTNLQRVKYNTEVHRALYPETMLHSDTVQRFMPGELIKFYANFTATIDSDQTLTDEQKKLLSKNGTLDVYNSEEAVIESVSDVYEAVISKEMVKELGINLPKFKVQEVTVNYNGIRFKTVVPLTPGTRSVQEFDGRTRRVAYNAADVLYDINQLLQNLYKTVLKYKWRRNSSEMKRFWELYREIQNRWCAIDFGYACTAHKAQGSTYEVVLIDENDMRYSGSNYANKKKIDKKKNLLELKKKSLLIYTGATRASNVVIVTIKDGDRNSKSLNSQIFRGDNDLKTLNDAINRKKPNGRPNVEVQKRTAKLQIDNVTLTNKNGSPVVVVEEGEGRENSILGNWVERPFIIDGQTYICVEQYIQAKKAELFKNEDAKKKIMAAKNGAECKHIGDAVTTKSPVDNNLWVLRKRDEAMIEAMTESFMLHDDVRLILLSTGSIPFSHNETVRTADTSMPKNLSVVRKTLLKKLDNKTTAKTEKKYSQTVVGINVPVMVEGDKIIIKKGNYDDLFNATIGWLRGDFGTNTEKQLMANVWLALTNKYNWSEETIKSALGNIDLLKEFLVQMGQIMHENPMLADNVEKISNTLANIKNNPKHFTNIPVSDKKVSVLLNASLPGSNVKMEIWWGSDEKDPKRSNPDLSNFAERPFIIQTVYYFADGTRESANIEFNSVEQAFQYAKLSYSKMDRLQKNRLATRIINAKSGKEAKNYGGKYWMKELDSQLWDEESPAIMKDLLKASFEQNPTALQRLLDTGNATLTHDNARKEDRWRTEFPKLLMEVREELRASQSQKQVVQTNQQLSSIQITESSGSYYQRTRENADWSDVTVAIAVDFSTAGETLTAQQAGSTDEKYLGDREPRKGVEDKYHPISISNIKGKSGVNATSYISNGMTDGKRWAETQKIKEKFPNGIKLNVAGNGIYTLAKEGITQEEVNEYLEGFLAGVRQAGVVINEVRSGGLTGIDEAGIIAALKLGIPASVHAPKNFRFRLADGKDVFSKEAFISRFNSPQQTLEQKRGITDTLTLGIPDEEFEEIEKQVDEPVDNKLDKSDSTNDEPEKKEKTPFEQAGDLIDKMKRDTEQIGFDEEPHIYYSINEDGTRGEDFNITVTQFNYQYLECPDDETPGSREEKDYGLWDTPSHVMGNTVDIITRDFFKGTLQEEYPNLTKEQLKALIDDLTEFRDVYLKKFFGDKKYQVVTDTIRFSGRVTYNGKTMTIAGSPDMLIYDNEGNFYIFDMKNKRQKMGEEDILSYTRQLTLYKMLLEANYPELRGRIKELRLIEFNNFYPNPFTDGIKYDTNPSYIKGLDELIVVKDGMTYGVEEFADGVKKDSKDKLYTSPRIYRESGEIETIPTDVNVLEELETNENFEIIPALKHKPADSEKAPEQNVNKQAPAQLKKLSEKDIKVADNSEKFALGMKELYESEYLTSGEILSYANKVVDAFSDVVTDLIANKENNEKYFGDQFKDIDFTTMTRIEVIQTITLNTLLDKCKELYFSGNNPDMPIDEDTLMACYDILEHWEQILLMAAPKLADMEKIGLFIQNVEDNVKVDLTDDTVPSDNNASDDSGQAERDQDEINDMTGNKQEHWQVAFRTISAYNSMSQEMKLKMSHFFVKETALNKDDGRVARDGIKLDKLGIKERYAADEITRKLLNWLNGSVTLEDMIKKLEEKKQSVGESWIDDLIQMLSDKENPENFNFQSEFVGVFMKHFQSYTIVYRDNNGTIILQQINSSPAVKEARQAAQVQYNIGESKLFHGEPEEVEKYRAELRSIASFKINKNSSGGTREELQGYIKEVLDLKTTTADDLENVTAYVNEALLLLGVFTDPEIIRASISDRDGNINKDVIRQIATSIAYISKHIAFGEKAFGETYNPFEFQTEANRKKAKYSIYGDVTQLFGFALDAANDTKLNSVYDDGKTYQSYVIPSYLSKLMLKFQESDEADFEKFMMDEYGQYARFKSPSTRDFRFGWRCPWLQKLATDKELRKNFKHTVVLRTDDSHYMKDMSTGKYALQMIKMFFSDKEGKYAWYRMPIMSNKPSAEYIQFARYGNEETYRENITDDLYKIFLQEIDRIITCNERALTDVLKIKNYDGQIKKGQLKEGNGQQFCFLDFMNKYRINETEYNNLLQRINNAPATVSNDERLAVMMFQKINRVQLTEDLTNSLNEQFADIAKQVIMREMEAKAESVVEKLVNMGVLEHMGDMQGIDKNAPEIGIIKPDSEKGIKGDTKEEILAKRNAYYKKLLMNFVWNDALATMNILELTVTDIAYYKNYIDLQKRLAQLHAPGIRCNVTALSPSKERVSDGISRNVVLEDQEGFFTNIKLNVAEVFARQESQVEDPKELEALRELHKQILEQFDKINVADAQAYSSPTSYRKKAIMFGKWSDEQERIYQQLLSGNYEYAELKKAFQPLKPFVYSQIKKEMHVDAPFATDKVPIQNKNAEYLLVMADAILRGEQTSRPNLLGAIFDVMEESAYDIVDNGDGTTTRVYRNDGIDTIEFESAVKSGLQGKVNLFSAATREEAKARLEQAIYLDRNSHEYNTDRVHEIPFEDYTIQLEVPEHFLEHMQSFGSQIRYIIPSDLPEFNADGTPIYYETTAYDEETKQQVKRKFTAKEFKMKYERTIAENIQEDLDNLRAELKLDSASRLEQNIALHKILDREIRNNIQRYGVDLLYAVQLVNGEFVLPLSDYAQATRIEQLLNSIIKNRVHKQEIAGGPVVQVSNFGTSKRLTMKFTGADGKELMSLDEYGAEKNLSGEELDEAYSKYLKNNQAGIAYMEVYAPAYMRSLLKDFMDGEGNINVEAVNETCPDLLKMIGYRIPTEDKYSIAPLRIAGFLPREAGEAIMLPYEITLLTGSDFDVDKEYIMHKKYTVVRNDKSVGEIAEGIVQELYDEGELIKSPVAEDHFGNVQSVINIINNFKKDPHKLDTDYENMVIKKYQMKAFTATLKYTSDKDKRNNEIIDMIYAVMTNPNVAPQVLNPGGFEEEKQLGYAVKIVKERANTSESTTLEELLKRSVDDLSDEANKADNLCFVDSQLQFYDLNNAGSTLIGIFAVHKVAHAVYSGDGYMLNASNTLGYAGTSQSSIPNTLAFEIDGQEYSFYDMIELDPLKDVLGNLIGKTLGSLVAASADTAKEPCLGNLNVNQQTSSALLTLVRIGVPLKTAALLLASNIVTDVINEFNIRSIDKEVSLSKVVNERLAALSDTIKKQTGSRPEETKKSSEAITEKDLSKGLTSSDAELNWKLLNAFNKTTLLAAVMSKFSYPTRLNSISNTVGPQIVDTMIMENKLADFPDGDTIKRSPITVTNADGSEEKLETMEGLESVYEAHPILGAFSGMVPLARELLGFMPIMQKQFQDLLDTYNLRSTFIKNRALFKKLQDFYMSYLAIASGFINPNEIDYYMNDFPKLFVLNDDANPRKIYPDNPLIKAIHPMQEKKSKRTYLSVQTLDLSNTDIDKLKNGWIDLYREEEKKIALDPSHKNLAVELLKYNFFRGGIGFSPKTFMKLLHTYLKTVIISNGVAYTDIFNNIALVNVRTVMDSFIRSNADEYSLVPTVRLNAGDFQVYNKSLGEIQVMHPEQFDGTMFFKVINSRNAITGKVESYNLYRLVYQAPGIMRYRLVPQLGERGDYFEAYTSDTLEKDGDFYHSTLAQRDQIALKKAEEEKKKTSAAKATVKKGKSDAKPTKKAVKNLNSSENADVIDINDIPVTDKAPDVISTEQPLNKPDVVDMAPVAPSNALDTYDVGDGPIVVDKGPQVIDLDPNTYEMPRVIAIPGEVVDKEQLVHVANEKKGLPEMGQLLDLAIKFLEDKNLTDSELADTKKSVINKLKFKQSLTSWLEESGLPADSETVDNIYKEIEKLC